jgi:hypothetical protein
MSSEVIPPFDTNQFELLRTEPRELVGPNSAIDEFSVRDFKHEDNLLFADFSILSAEIGLFCSPVESYVYDVSKERYGKEVDSRNHANFGRVIIHPLQKKLIDPKVKTGTITQLNILMVDPVKEPAALPHAMVANFLANNKKPRQTLEYMTGYETFFRIFGKVKMGSFLAPIACGVCVTPYIDSAHIGNKYGWSDKPYVRTSAQVEKYSQRGLTSDSAGWDNVIEQSKRREAVAKIHPISGGLVNPR